MDLNICAELWTLDITNYRMCSVSCEVKLHPFRKHIQMMPAVIVLGVVTIPLPGVCNPGSAQGQYITHSMLLQHCIVCIFWHSALSILALATLWYLDTPCSPLPAAAALKSEIAPIIRIINFVSSSLSSSASTSGQPPAAGSAEKNFSRPECCQLMLTPDPHQQLQLRRCCCWRLLSANLKDNGRKWQDRKR